MSIIHHTCDCLDLRTPRRALAPRPALLSVIALLLEAFGEALEMRRAALRKFPFAEE